MKSALEAVFSCPSIVYPNGGIAIIGLTPRHFGAGGAAEAIGSDGRYH